MQGYIDPARLVFIDESGVNTKMTRLYGWGPRAKRVRSKTPFGHWKTMTFVAGLRLTGMVAPWVLDGAMDGDAFPTYIDKVLAPTLAQDDIVVMDNLPAHKVAGIADLIHERKAQLFYLPPYSPDMNPIENAFSKLKTLLRTAEERSINSLINRIGKITDLISPQECQGFFRNAGYQQSS